MDIFAVVAVVLTLTALFSYVNTRFLRLPTAIGVMAGALAVSLLLVLLGSFAAPVRTFALDLLERLDFDELLLDGMLSFLLFAGALHVDLGSLREQTSAIGTLALVGVVVSTFLIGGATWLALDLIGLTLPFLWALAFGALISPTDPIAVLGVLRKAGAPKRTETLIVGESLFNDGMGVVVFGVVASLLVGEREPTPGDLLHLFTVEAIGGIVLGLGLGVAAFGLLRSVDDYTTEILITLAVVTGGYALAGSLHTSGPLAMVVAGLFVGNHGRLFAMSSRTREHLDTFWLLVDEILNGVLFVIIGMEVLVVDLDQRHLLAAAVALPLVLLVRLLSVSAPIAVLRRRHGYDRYTISLLTWGGLRGGISVALVLSLPAGDERSYLLTMTYAVVAFSILVQGTTVGRLASRAARARAA